MKSYEEIAENVLKRRDEYLAAKNKRHSRLIRTVSYFTGIAAAAAAAVMIYSSTLLNEVKPDPDAQYNITEYYNTQNSENTSVTSGIPSSSVPAETTSPATDTTDFFPAAVIISESSVSAVTEPRTDSAVSAVTEPFTDSAVSAKPAEIFTTDIRNPEPEIHTTSADISESVIPTTAADIYEPEIAITDAPEIRTTAAENSPTVIKTESPEIPCITESPEITDSASQETGISPTQCVSPGTVPHSPATAKPQTEKTTMPDTELFPAATANSTSENTTESTTTTAVAAVISRPPETAFPETVTTTA